MVPPPLVAIRHHGLILVVAGLVFFTNLGAAGLFDEDEPKNAACAQEMFARGDWIVPTFNHQLRTDKPILLYWLTLAAYQCLGVSELSARLASAVLATGTALVTYHLGRMLFSPTAGLWAAVIVSTSLMFDVVARAATPDSTLVFFTTLTLATYVGVVARGRSGGFATAAADGRAQSHLLGSLPATAALYGAMGLAVLAKGPVGVVLPVAALGLFLVCLAERRSPPEEIAVAARGMQRWWRSAIAWLLRTFTPGRLLLATGQLRPLAGLIVVALVALPWYVAVGLATRGEWLAGFLGNHNVGRFVSAMENHRGPIFYYVLAIMIGFFPWSIFLTLTTLDAARRLRARHPHWPSYLLLVCWTLLYVVFFSLARTKLPNYVLPVYPALAVLTAALVEHWLHEPAALSPRLLRVALGSLCVVGVGTTIGVGIAAWLLLPGDLPLALVGLIPLAGGGAALYFHRRATHASTPEQRGSAAAPVADQAGGANDGGRAHGDPAVFRPGSTTLGVAPIATRRAALAVAITAVAFSVSLFGWASHRVGRHQTSRPLLAAAREASAGPVRLAAYGYFEPSLVFYARTEVLRPRTTDELAALVHDDPSLHVVVRASDMDALADVLPPGAEVIYRHRRFLRRGELCLVGPSATRVAAAAGTRAAATSAESAESAESATSAASSTSATPATSRGEAPHPPRSNATR